MKPILKMKGRTFKVKVPYEGASYADVPDVKCPLCNEDLTVQGTGKRIKNYDTYEAGAICVKCKKLVGELQVKVSTFFGLEEDERVFSMGIKVY
jgi:hypothetical protein